MNQTITVALPQLPALMARLKTKAEASLQRGIQSAAMRASPIMENAVRTAPPANPARKGVGGAVNTANYLRSWKSRPQRTATGIGLLIYTGGVPYSGVIEYGRRAGARMPPAEPITRWAQRRFSIPYDEAKRISFVIRRAIKRRGLLPRHVLTSEKTQNQLVSAFQEEVLRELIAAIGAP